MKKITLSLLAVLLVGMMFTSCAPTVGGMTPPVVEEENSEGNTGTEQEELKEFGFEMQYYQDTAWKCLEKKTEDPQRLTVKNSVQFFPKVTDALSNTLSDITVEYSVAVIVGGEELSKDQISGYYEVNNNIITFTLENKGSYTVQLGVTVSKDDYNQQYEFYSFTFDTKN